MFDVFGALIGGLYYAIKGIFSSKKYNDAIMRREKSDMIHKDLSATGDEEEAVRKLLREHTGFESIGDEMLELYGHKWRDIVLNCVNANCDFLTNPLGFAFHILLSKQYKVPRMFSKQYDLGGMTDEERKRVITACKIIEHNIQQKYSDLRILFVPGMKVSQNSSTAEFYDELYNGYLCWEHNIPMRNSKWNPDIRRLW